MKLIVLLLVGFAAARPQDSYDYPSYGSDTGVPAVPSVPDYGMPQIEEQPAFAPLATESPDYAVVTDYDGLVRKVRQDEFTTMDSDYFRKAREAGGDSEFTTVEAVTDSY